jgi:3',5'-nucleoside bisphosphate phosphatase
MSSLPADSAVDLHLHTIYSDGQWLPEELFDYLADTGFRVVSITDHDTLAHQGELRLLGEERGIRVLPGVEVTSRWRGLIAHVLCYSGQFTSEALASLVDDTRERQLENIRSVHTELERRGYRFPQRDQVLAAQQGQLVRPIDNARLLVDHGLVHDMEQALQLIADAGYVICAAPIEAAVEAAHASGAVALLAHPGRGGDGGEIPLYSPELVAELLRSVPLDGIEVYYPTHSEELTENYIKLAGDRGLLTSAGSDSHGPRGRLPIAYRMELCNQLLIRCGMVPIP